MGPAAKGAPMTEQDVVTVRFAVLENLCLAALTLYLANLRSGPDGSKSDELIDLIQAGVEQSIAHLPQETRKHGTDITRDLFDRLRHGVQALKEGQPQGLNNDPAPR